MDYQLRLRKTYCCVYRRPIQGIHQGGDGTCAFKGLLESRQGAGVFVVSTTTSETWANVLQHADIAAVIEVRVAIEVEAAGLAALRRTPTDLRKLKVLLAARKKTAADGTNVEFVQADIAFHEAIVKSAHNPVLSDLFATFVPRLTQSMIDMLWLGRRGVVHLNDHDEHEAILKAIREKDAQGAVAVSRAHLGAVGRRHRTGSR